MLTPAIISLLVGMVLAQRFKVLILFPVIMLTVVLAVSVGIARADATWAAALTLVVVIVGLQLGFLLGIGVRHVMLLTRASRLRATSLTSSLRPQRPTH